MIKDVDLKLKYVDGESFVHHPPVFSSDSQFVFIASLRRLYSYTTKTGKRFVEFKGIDNDIVNFGVYQKEGTEFLIACTVNGNVICWKASSGLKVKQTNLTIEKVKFFEVFETFGKNYAFLSWVNKDGLLTTGLLDLSKFNLKTLSIIYKNGRNSKLAIGGYQRSENANIQTFAVFVSGRKMFIDQVFNDKAKQVKIKIVKRKFTAIAAHASEIAILSGDDTGRVVLWQNIFGDYTQSVFHWHTLPVNTISFSASGTSFYSGADECVLVKWTADDSTQKRFLPRLSNCIQQLKTSTENLYLAIATKDNAVHIIDMQFNLISVIQELILGDYFPAGIHVDPKTRALVMNGTIGHLQFYSPQNKQLLYNLDVVGMNRITNERSNHIENTQIGLVAISRNGMWMATVEERCDADEFFESRLKFWSFNEAKQSFQLNTNVEYAHDGKVIDLKFQPTTKTDLQLVTIGADGFFKVWKLVDVTSVYTKGFSWRCAISGFYRNLKPETIAFSYDGSLLAVAFENILTTWLPETLALKCSLLHSMYSEKIEHVAFGTSTQCHLVVVASRKRLCVWNLLTLSMVWTVPLRVKHLVTDPMTVHMGVITQNNKLFIFEPACETPLYVHDALVDDTKTVMAAILVPTGRVYHHRTQQNWHDKTQLYIIDSNKELHCFDNSSGYDDAMLEPMHFLLNESETQTVFGQLTPALKSGGEKKPTQIVHNFTQKLSKSKLDDLLEGSIHTMVPMRMIAHAIINSMIYQKPKQIGNEESESLDNVVLTKNIDKPMDVDNLAEDLCKIALEPVTWTSVLTKA